MAMNIDYKGVVIGTLTADTSSDFVAGRAVRMGTDGKVTTPLASKRVLGLIGESRIAAANINEIGGAAGIYGSGKATVVMGGVVTVQTVSYAGTSYAVYDTSLVYTADDTIFATPSTGVLTNVAPAGATSDGMTSVRVGRVLVPPTNPANGDPMQISVEIA